MQGYNAKKKLGRIEKIHGSGEAQSELIKQRHHLHMPRPCQRHPYSRYDEKSQVFRAENVSVCLCLCHNKAAFIVLRLG